MDAIGNILGNDVTISLLKIVIVFSLLMLGVSIMTWVERRVSAIIQYRLGPNRVGPFGLFQPFADGIKFISRKNIVPPPKPTGSFPAGPVPAWVPALCAFAVIPFGFREVMNLRQERSRSSSSIWTAACCGAFAATGLGVLRARCWRALVSSNMQVLADRGLCARPRR
jgi:NADH-quinone oxidoreductase subunit H